MTHYLGVDQTGAINTRGEPKPLPSCLIIGNQIRPFYLKKFNQHSLSEVLSPGEFINLKICMDCVLGLPKELKLPWRMAIQKASEIKTYGRAPAQSFFREILSERKIKHIPTRQVEALCRANSVFQERPFQKNIQTGTFRFWKEMALEPHWFYVPRLSGEKKYSRSRIPIMEGYPSLAWRLLFGVNRREPENLFRHLKTHFPEMRFSPVQLKLFQSDANLADAAVLALLARKLMNQELSGPATQEGWILGAQAS